MDAATQETLFLKGRLRIGAAHGLLLVALKPPEAGARPTILRYFGARPIEVPLEAPAALFSAELGEAIVGREGPPPDDAARLQILLDRHLRTLLADASVYGAYYEAGCRLAAANYLRDADRPIPAPDEAARETVEGVHRDLLTRMEADLRDARFGFAFETSGGAKRSVGVRIPFVPDPVRGLPAGEIRVGAIVAPEPERNRLYRVTAISETEDPNLLRFHLAHREGGDPVGILLARRFERVRLVSVDETLLLPEEPPLERYRGPLRLLAFTSAAIVLGLGIAYSLALLLP